MPQEHHIVRCFKCETFQVQIVKKIKKFECKMCGEKQSIKKEYGRGSGKDCRLHVQKLRDLQIQNASNEISAKLSVVEENSQSFSEEEEEWTEKLSNNETKNQISKWSEFIETKESRESDDQIDPKFSKYTFERPGKRKRTNINCTKTSRPSKKPVIEKESTYCQPNNYHSDDSDDSLNKSCKPTFNQNNFKITLSKETRNINSGIKKNMKPSKWNNFVSSDSSDNELKSSSKLKNNVIQNFDSNPGPRVNNFEQVQNPNIKTKNSKWDNFLATNNSDIKEHGDDQICNVSNKNFDANSSSTLNNANLKKINATKPSKWDNFVVSKTFSDTDQASSNFSDSTPDMDDDSQKNIETELVKNEREKINYQDGVKSIFKTDDDDDLDEILDF